MNKYLLIFIVFASILMIGCKKPKNAEDVSTIDSTAVAADTLIGNIEGVDSTLIND